MKKVVALLLLAGLFVLSSGCRPTQVHPELPNSEDLLRVDLFTQDDVQVKQIQDIDKINDLINNLTKESTFTKRESVNDQPTNIKEYYLLAFIFDKDSESSRAYIYGNKGKYYFEQPYKGIWEISEKTFHTIIQ